MRPSPLLHYGPDDAEAAGCAAAFAASLAAAERRETPYRHWQLSEALPRDLAAQLDPLPFEAPDLGGVSGARELHNNTRRYFDDATIDAYPAAHVLAEAFHADETVAAIERVTGAQLDGCCLRIEYAQDVDGFWLAPHTDLGVKRFTMLYYLGPAGHEGLGTDIYADAATWVRRAPFIPGHAMVFVPSGSTWHGFAPRPIPCVRKSLIINYVTAEWRDREQLAWPDIPVRGRR